MKFANDLLRVATAVLLVAQSTQSSRAETNRGEVPDAAHNRWIPWSELGSKVTAQYSGDGLAVFTGPQGAVRLRCVFQKLEGEATHEGLWLNSSIGGQAANRFQAMADSLGREGSTMVPLPKSGAVGCETGLAFFSRPGLQEEYVPTVDGVRQDFIVAQRPSGAGRLRVELALRGVRAEASSPGVNLVLEGSGRKLTYSRLRVTDAAGKELAAQLEVVSDRRLAVLADDCEADYPVRVDPTFSDANWVSMGGFPGVGHYYGGGGVGGAVVDGSGNLYIGGYFTMVGDIFATNVAKWNGTNWSALGFSGENSGVRAVAELGGTLYVAGSFTNVSGVPANCIAKWDGTNWSALGSGVDWVASSLATSGSDVYVGGGFTNAGGIEVNKIAKWDGNNWNALGSGVRPDYATGVSALSVSGGDVYAGGMFTQIGGVDANYIAKWDGNAWSPLGSGIVLGPYNGTVRVLFASGSNLYVGGGFTNAGGVKCLGVAKWDGQKWSSLGAGLSDGADPGAASVFVNANGGLYVGGGFSLAGEVAATGIAKWSGTNWSALGDGLNSYVAAWAISGDQIYAGGRFQGVGLEQANFIARWNGNGWSAVGSGLTVPVDYLAFSGMDLYAGGWLRDDTGGVIGGFVSKLSGDHWTSLNSPPGPLGGLAVFQGQIHVSGEFGVAKWDGTNWSSLGSSSGWVGPLLAQGSYLYAGGNFTSIGGTTANCIAKWDGHLWSALGSGMTSPNLGFPGVGALAIAANGRYLYAAGKFEQAGNVGATNIACWDGSNWSALDSGVRLSLNPWDGAGYTLAVSGDDLYVGGYFDTAGGIPAHNIARWNGSQWSALGSGFDGTVPALAVAGSELFVAGYGIRANVISPFAVRAYLERPTLAIQASGGNLTLSWPAFYGDFLLEQNSRLANTNGWSLSGYPMVTNGSIKSATAPLTSTNGFFRLTGN